MGSAPGELEFGGEEGEGVGGVLSVVGVGVGRKAGHEALDEGVGEGEGWMGGDIVLRGSSE